MNRGVLQSSPVQQMMVAGSPNSWWNMNNMRAAPPVMQPTSPFLAPPVHPSLLIPQYLPPPPPPTSGSSSGWTDLNQELPESWSQLLLGGYVGEEDHNKASKKVENWEEQLLHQQHHPAPPHAAPVVVDHHQYGHENAELIQATTKSSNNWSTQMMPISSPTSCVTTLSNNMLDFSGNNKSDARHPPPDRSSECNSSTATGGAAKKARVQSSSTQSTFKVRKEKLGDRITALHQLVSPFGKTDTASVLLEAIGYIRFLQSQTEALSLPYLGNKSGNNNTMITRQQQPVQGERNCLFPEDPGQLLNDNSMKRKAASEQESELEEGKKDLRSRGLCLVPLSCTMQVGSDNGADYWAPALGGGFR